MVMLAIIASAHTMSMSHSGVLGQEKAGSPLLVQLQIVLVPRICTPLWFLRIIRVQSCWFKHTVNLVARVTHDPIIMCSAPVDPMDHHQH